MTADRESSAERGAVQEHRVPKNASRLLCRFCGAPVTFVATDGGPRCLDLRTVRTAKRGQQMAVQHRCMARGDSRG